MHDYRQQGSISELLLDSKKYGLRHTLGSGIAVSIFFIFCGCATVFNESTQDVPVKIPKGTIVKNWDGSQLPLYHVPHSNDTLTYLRLKRSNNYTLTFINGKREAKVIMQRSIDGGWLGADFFFYVVPLLIDAGTGAWHSFEGVAIDFDSSYVKVGPFDPEREESLNIIALAALGHVGLSSGYFIPILLTNEFFFGIGYNFFEDFSVIGEWNFGHDLDLIPDTKEYYYDYSDFSSFQIQGRYKFFGDVYAALGGGITHASVDNIWYYDDNYKRFIEPGTKATFPTALAAIGLSGKTGYVELRHTLGFGKLIFPNGEQTRFESTSLHFGFNFHF